MKFLVILACIAYVVWPIDLIPDFIPVAGWLDDGGAIITAIMTALSGRKK
jgi:uncharacterized membrane protein YkvA (DUF1232 family)